MTTAPAAVSADYVDLRFIKSRKVAQILVEIPIEAAGAFVAAFGTPDPSKSVPVAIARLDPTAQRQRQAELEAAYDAALRNPAPAKPKGGKLAQQAGMLCSEFSFAKFLIEKHGLSGPDNEDTYEAVKKYVRAYCGVYSRSELDHNANAARNFQNLRNEYNAWLSHG